MAARNGPVPAGERALARITRESTATADTASGREEGPRGAPRPTCAPRAVVAPPAAPDPSAAPRAA